MLILPDGSTVGTIGGGCAERGVISEALEALSVGGPRTLSMVLEEESRGGVGMRCGGELEVFIDVFKSPAKLVVFGGGHVGKEIAKLGGELGFEVTVVDPAIGAPDFHPSVKFIQEPFEEGAKHAEITPETYVVISTQHKDDERALRAVIDSPAKYIGMLGSRSRVKGTFEKLAEEGVPREKLERVYAPIGLDIGAQTPKEIAVSVLAEIIKIARKPSATGKSLRELTKP
jgi:xanthine dehydrogenase accessory factor